MSEETHTGETVDAAGPVHEGNEQSQAHGQVPLDALQAERAERQRVQEELKVIKDNMALMMSQQRGGQVPQQNQQEQAMSKDDVLTYGELEQILSKKEQAYNSSLKEIQMMQRYPDYQEVITRYLPEVLKSNPSLHSTLSQTQDYELAYYLASNSEGYKHKRQRTTQNADAERILQNSQKAGALSSVGRTSPVNTARRYKEMSDDEFRKVVNQNMGHF